MGRYGISTSLSLCLALHLTPLSVFCQTSPPTPNHSAAISQDHASEPKSCPNWSPKFDQIQDEDIEQVLRAHMKQGWDSLIQQGVAMKIGVQQQISDCETQLQDSREALSRYENLLHLRGNRLPPPTSPQQCANLTPGSSLSALCQVRSLRDQIAAFDGMLDLLRCRSVSSGRSAQSSPNANETERPPASAGAEQQTSNENQGEARNEHVIAVVTVHVTAAPPNETTPGSAGAPSKPRSVVWGLEQNHRTLEIPVGTIVYLSFPASAAASRFRLESSQGALETPKGVIHLPSGSLGFLRAVRPGSAQITVWGRVAGPKFGGDGNPGETISPNWSGYVLNGGPFTSIQGQWHVPNVQSPNGASATWVGIDGSSITNLTLIQSGTSQNLNGGFLGIGEGPSFSAWWEIIPAFPNTISLPVQANDEMRAFISALSGSAAVPGSPGQWVIDLVDVTQNWDFPIVETYSGELSSAEWIEEDPALCGPFGCAFEPLTDYGSVTFDILDRVQPGGSPNFAVSEALSISQDGGVTFLSTPSNPDGDLDGFTVAFGSNIPPAPGPFITTTSLPPATVGEFYATTLQFTGVGVSSVDWSGTGLPPGLTLGQTTGTISGTPTAVGTFNISVIAEDANNPGAFSQTQQLPLTVNRLFPLFRPTCFFSELLKRWICF